LAKLNQANPLKEQVDVARQKEVVLKMHVEPWIDEAFLITTDIEGKLAKMKVMHAISQGSAPHSENSAETVEKIQQMVEQYDADLRAAQAQLEGLHAKIAAPIE